MRRLAAAIALLALAGCTTTLDRFEATLAAQDSATAALEDWCGAKVTAVPAGGPDLPAASQDRALLEVSESEPLRYRHVRLNCGGKVLSEAHNWYVPARLTADMNRQLDTTDTPFGKVIASLRFTRERISGAGVEGCPPDSILRHKALLRLPDGRPVSLVIECYTPANLR
jgi:chorismate-pyruvate lyase